MRRLLCRGSYQRSYKSFSVVFLPCYFVVLRHEDGEAFLRLLYGHWQRFCRQTQRQMPILYQHCDILFLVYYVSIYVLVYAWCLHNIRLQMLPILVTGLNVTILTMFLHLSKFGKSLSFVTNFSKSRTKAPTPTVRFLCLPTRKTMRCGQRV